MAGMAHSPRHQAARQRGAQTGERFEQAWEGIRQDQCDYQRPIPDAATLAQQRLEAAVVYALVEGFRHEWGVVDRAALAIASVRPEPDRLTIDPVAGRELEVLTLLLPYYDGRPGQMGNFFGVPGLRLRPDGQDRDYWELGWLDETGRDRGTQLRIRRPRPRPGAHLLPPTPGSGADDQPGPQDFYRELAPLWHTHPGSISDVERARDLRGYCDYPADQAELLSRLLRRPRLLVWPAGRGARAVCLYHHARLDLVVEWFGGPPVAEVAGAFLAAGLDLQPRDRAAQGLRDGTWPEWTLKLHAGTMELVLLPQVEPSHEVAWPPPATPTDRP
jgi:hypothetical protein